MKRFTAIEAEDEFEPMRDAEWLEAAWWAQRADEAAREGFEGADESEKTLRTLLIPPPR